MKGHLKEKKGHGRNFDLAYMVGIEKGKVQDHPTKRGVRGVSPSSVQYNRGLVMIHHVRFA